MRVVGVDPGSRYTGWGIIEENSGCLRLVECGVIKTVKRPDTSFSSRLCAIYHELCLILKRYRPEVAAIEQTFMAKNVNSALRLGHARGVGVAACAALGLDIYDYEPTLIKKAIVGTGRADKEQVAFMVKRLLNVKNVDWALDATDALAVAICHLNQTRYMELTSKKGIATGQTA